MKIHSNKSGFLGFLGCSVFFVAALVFFAPSAWAADDAEKYFIAGNEYAQKGNFPKAIEAYQKAIKINGTIADIHYNLANTYVAAAAGKTAQADFEKAVKEYQTAIALNPLKPEYHRNLGFAFALQKKGDLAREKYEELKKISPPHAEELMSWIKRENRNK